jgi:hypothetical protein
MPDLHELELELLERKGVSRYKAVLMSSQEARFVNNQLRMGIIESKDKPATLALRKLFEGRIIEDAEEQAV